MKRRRVMLLVFVLVVTVLILTPLAVLKIRQSEFDRSLDKIISPYKFDFFGWEVKHLWSYFISRSSLSPREKLLRDQVKEVLREEGIVGQIFFPPLAFEIETPPKILIISPRDSIEIVEDIELIPDLDVATMAEIEEAIDQFNVSSLIIGTGGMAIYPAMVLGHSSLRWTLRAIAHEWLHHYLYFKPLGFRYLLHFLGKRDHQIAVINETVANIVGKEIGDLVYYKYYGDSSLTEAAGGEPPPEFNFMMKEIRMKVDQLLAEGRVAEAENYMKERRHFLEEKGYPIRKFNQAYFAFHSTYADSPASVDPIGEKLKALRASCSSLKEFLEKVQSIGSVEDLDKIVVD